MREMNYDDAWIIQRIISMSRLIFEDNGCYIERGDCWLGIYLAIDIYISLIYITRSVVSYNTTIYLQQRIWRRSTPGIRFAINQSNPASLSLWKCLPMPSLPSHSSPAPGKEREGRIPPHADAKPLRLVFLSSLRPCCSIISHDIIPFHECPTHTHNHPYIHTYSSQKRVLVLRYSTPAWKGNK